MPIFKIIGSPIVVCSVSISIDKAIELFDFSFTQANKNKIVNRMGFLAMVFFLFF